MAYTADDVPFLRLLASSADRTLADEATSALAGMVLKFDVDELRDDHGRWSAVGAAVHALEHAAEDVGHHDGPAPEPGRDKLKLHGKIHLDPGERLVGSSKVSDEYGSVRLAATDKGGERLLRLGVGGWAFGKPNKSEGTVAWTGGPDKFGEHEDALARRGAEHEALGQQLDETPEGPERDAIGRRMEELEEAGSGGEIIGGGHTMRLDEAGAKRLRDVLADAHPRAQAETDRLNSMWAELGALDVRLDQFWEKDKRNEHYTDDEQDEFKRVLARRKQLSGELGEGKYVPATTIAEGTISGEWGTLHYDAYVDEPEAGPQLDLLVVPHGVDAHDVTGIEEDAVLGSEQWQQLIQQLDSLMPAGAGKASGADLLKWTYNPSQSRVGGRFASGTGSNITSGGDVRVSGRQGGSVAAIKPLNAAAARASSGKPINGAAARLTPKPAPPPPPRPAAKPKPKPAAKPKPKPAAKPAARPTPGPEAATRSPHTAIGSHDGDTLTVSHRSTTQSRQADARERSRQAAVRAQQRAELNAVRASLAATKAKTSKATTAQRNAAVAAMKSKYGIPKSLRHVSKDRQHAVAAMDSATRQMVTDRARIATAQAQVAAVRAQYRKGQSAATSAYLNKALAQAQARLNAASGALSADQKTFDAAAKKWRGH